MECELKQHKYAVTEYQNTEKELLTQAENVKKSLKNTINHRDILFEKIDKRQQIENENEEKWNEKKSQLTSMISLIQHQMIQFRADYDEKVEENVRCISAANEEIQEMQVM